MTSRLDLDAVHYLMAAIPEFIDRGTREYRTGPPDPSAPGTWADRLTEFLAVWQPLSEQRQAALLARAFPRQCYWISGVDLDGGQHVPAVRTEFTPGYQLMSGNGRFASPWRWGDTLETAQRICDDANRDTFGLTPDDAFEIVLSSQLADPGPRDDGDFKAILADLDIV